MMHSSRVIILLAGVAAVLALPAEANAAEAKTYLEQFFYRGGPITWFLLLPLSVCTVGLAVQYSVSIKRSLLLPDVVRAQIKALFDQRQYREALEFTAAEPSMLSRVMHATLGEASSGYAAMERAMEDAAQERTARVLRRIEWLNVIGNIAPMIGLFGTVTGMIQAFNEIVKAGGMPDPSNLADGISTALVTTFWGLAVAIPALAIYAIFRNRIDVVSAEVALAAQELISPFKPGGRTAGPTAAKKAAAQPQAQQQRQPAKEQA